MGPLAAYFARHQKTKRKIDLAKAVGVTPGRVSQLLRGQRPGLALALAINHWTSGEVRPEDWPPPPPKKKRPASGRQKRACPAHAPERVAS